MKLRVYTDGACSGNPGPGGWAALFLLSKENFIIGGNKKNTTNNCMELAAVVKALQHFADCYNNGISMMNYNEIEINLDSAYVVNAINKKWVDAWKTNDWKTSNKEEVKNKYLWKEILRLTEEIEKSGIKITFVKVRGHSGDCFNDIADKRAKEEVKAAKLKEGVL